MKTQVFINLEGKRSFVGLMASDHREIVFQYASAFLKSGLEISPLAVPLQSGILKFASAPFGGLPGFAADSLPDGWGNLLLNRQLVRRGERLSDIDPLRRLCWVGSHGMGALEYEPEESAVNEFPADEIRLDVLAEDADAILAERDSGSALDALACLNGSSGGARPKIVCLVSADGHRLMPGTMARDGAQPWIVKFRNSTDPKEIGALEYAVSLLAGRAGIEMPQTKLFDSKIGAGWFGVQRFDRSSSGKFHAATAAGLLHCDFRTPCIDYQTLMALTQRLSVAGDREQMLRRAYFNFVIDNRDDHAKNFSFLMNGRGSWRLAPAYDLVPNTGAVEHMTSLYGCGKAPSRKLFVKLGEDFGMSRARVNTILEEIDDSLLQWKRLAVECGIRRPPIFEPIR